MKLLLQLLSVLLDTFDKLFDAVGELLSNLSGHFPNLVRMADDLIGFFTGITAILLGSIATINLRAARIVIKRDFATKLIRPDQAIVFIEHCVIKTVATVTQTGSQGLQQFILQRLSLWAYHLFKRFKFLMAILKVKTSDDMLKIFLKAARFRMALLTIAAAMAILFFLIAATSEVVGAMILINSDDMKRFLLSQDSKKVRGIIRGQFRVNVRTGPDRNE